MPVFSRANKFGEPFTPYLNGGEFIDVNTVRNTLSEITKVLSSPARPLFSFPEKNSYLPPVFRQIDFVIRPGRYFTFEGDFVIGNVKLALCPVKNIAAFLITFKITLIFCQLPHIVDFVQRSIFWAVSIGSR